MKRSCFKANGDLQSRSNRPLYQLVSVRPILNMVLRDYAKVNYWTKPFIAFRRVN